ncbi:MAG: hypothetical protein AAGJ52_07625 [Pseudomonadota bacterium]
MITKALFWLWVKSGDRIPLLAFWWAAYQTVWAILMPESGGGG